MQVNVRGQKNGPSIFVENNLEAKQNNQLITIKLMKGKVFDRLNILGSVFLSFTVL